MPDTWPDVDLLGCLRAAAAGDARSRDHLLTALHCPLKRYLLRHLRGESDPEDVAADVLQEALIRIARSLSECRADSSEVVMGWAIVITRNALIDHFRRASSGLGPRLLRLREADTPDEPQEEAPNPDTRALERIMREQREALSPETARLVQLRVEQGATWPEVAVEMEASEYAVKRRFARLRASLRRRILREVEKLPRRERAAISDRLGID